MGFALLVAYCPMVLIWPTHKHWHCHGRGVIYKGRKAKRCKRCRATGRVRWVGATLIHRGFWAVVGDPVRARLKESAKQRVRSS